jgi:hypothetical protein
MEGVKPMQWLVAAAVSWLVAYTGQAVPDNAIQWERLSIVARRLGGRALGCLIRKGMTGEQVNCLLAVYPTDAFGICGYSWSCVDYDYYGVAVYFCWEGEGWRVTSLDYAPLFGD